MRVTEEPLWTVEDLSAFLQKPRATLYQWRSRGLGPPAIKVGRDLRYRRQDVEQWLTWLVAIGQDVHSR